MSCDNIDFVTYCIGNLSRRLNMSAVDIFYNSPLLPLLEEGIADLHCRSDKYLAEEIWREREEIKND